MHLQRQVQNAGVIVTFLGTNCTHSLFKSRSARRAVLVGPPLTSLIRAHAICTRALVFPSFSLCPFLFVSLSISRSRFLGYARLWRIPGATALLFRGELIGALPRSRAQKFTPSLFAEQLRVDVDVTETRVARSTSWLSLVSFSDGNPICNGSMRLRPRERASTARVQEPRNLLLWGGRWRVPVRSGGQLTDRMDPT